MASSDDARVRRDGRLRWSCIDPAREGVRAPTRTGLVHARGELSLSRCELGSVPVSVEHRSQTRHVLAQPVDNLGHGPVRGSGGLLDDLVETGEQVGLPPSLHRLEQLALAAERFEGRRRGVPPELSVAPAVRNGEYPAQHLGPAVHLIPAHVDSLSCTNGKTRYRGYITMLAAVTDVKSRREEYSQATRQGLLDSATRLFAAQGYARTSLEEVAVAARVTKGALYGHFAGKQALFQEVLEELERTVVGGVRAAAEAVEAPWDSAMTGLRAFLEACRDPVYGRVVMREGPVALSYAEWSACESLYSYALVTDMLGLLVVAGEIDPLPLEPAARITHSMIGAAAMRIAEAEPADQSQVHAEVEEVVIRFFEGMRRRPPL